MTVSFVAGTPGDTGTVTTATSVTLPLPSGVASGDYLLAVVASVSSASGIVSPAGWTALLPNSDSDVASGSASHHMAVFGKAWASGDTSLTVTVGSGRAVGVILRAVGTKTTGPVDVTGTVQKTTAVGTQVVAPSLTTVNGTTLLTLHSARNQVTGGTTTWNLPANLAELVDYSASAASTNPSFVLGTQQVTAGAATGDQTAFSSSSQTGAQGWAMAFTAAAVPGGTLQSRVVGIPGTTTARVAVRTSNATSVRLKVGTDSAVTQNVIFGPAVTPNAQGDSVLTVSGLTTTTRQFYYRVGMTNAGVENFDTGTVGRFRTAPTGATSFAFNFGSCTNANDSGAMASMATRGDDLFFHLGDLYYNDGGSTGISNFRTQIASKLQATNHSALLSTTPSVWTPSDHEGMVNDGAGGDDPTAWANFNQAFREQWPAPASLPATLGVYHSFVWGRVRFIVLDDRTFKSPIANPDDANHTALGSVQKQWLKDTITAATETAIVIAQSAPWQDSGDPGGDGWGGFLTERNELAAFFAASGKKILMLAGDMHALAGVSSATAYGGITLFQAAPFHNGTSIKGGPYTVGPYPASGSATAEQYGRVAVTDDGTTMTLAFTGYTADNTARVTLSTTSADLAPAPAPGYPKAWNGTAEVAKPQKYWNGTAWVQKPLKKWTGTAWVAVHN